MRGPGAFAPHSRVSAGSGKRQGSSTSGVIRRRPRVVKGVQDMVGRHRAAAAALLVVLAYPGWLAAQDGKPAGVERFHRVDTRLFRGAQPTEAGLKALRDAGVQTIINLRDDTDGGFDER